MRKSFVGVAVSALLVLGVGASLVDGDDGSAVEATGAPGTAHLQKVATVIPDASGAEVHFRRTPTVQSLNGSQFGNEIFTVPGPADVTVRCIADDINPHSSRGKWYYVTLDGPPYPNASGYVWGNLIHGAPPVPACAPAIVDAHPFLPGALTLARGPANGQAYWYAITLRGFHPNFHYTVSCYDDNMVFDIRHTNPFKTFRLRTDGAGNAFTDKGCYSGEGERHWVTIGPYETDFVEWTATPPQTSTPPPTRTSPTAAVEHSPAPIRSTERQQNSPTPPPPAPETRVITVQNQVTSGATAMREDTTAAYLSSHPAPYCKRDQCAVAGTDMGTGATITALCRTSGPRMTNGQDSSGVDDGNAGLITSSLWYQARTGDGREGFISEVYIRPDDRGGLGLPICS